MLYEKSLLKMSDAELIKVLHNATGCLVCEKAISYKILGSRFCYECNKKHPEDIRALMKRSRVMRTEEGGFKHVKC